MSCLESEMSNLSCCGASSVKYFRLRLGLGRLAEVRQTCPSRCGEKKFADKLHCLSLSSLSVLCECVLTCKMSQPSKRDAATAFEDAVNVNPHTSKRRRRRDRNHGDKNVPKGASVETSLATLAPENDKKRLSKADHKHSSTDKISLDTAARDHARTPQASSKLQGVVKEMDVKENKKANSGKWATKSKKGGELVKKEHPSSKEGLANTSSWALSRSNGGVFIQQDPILTPDDQHLILATSSEVQVYATKTSLLVRSFVVDRRSDITSCSLSTSDSTKLYASSSSGLLSMWDWTSSAKMSQHDTGKGVHQVLPIHSRQGREFILVLRRTEGKGESAIVYAIDPSTKKFTKLQAVLKTTDLLLDMKSYAQGSILVACMDDKLLVGESRIGEDGELDLTYAWREVKVNGAVTSFDAQINPGKSKSTRRVPILDIAIGLNNGAIVHYEDILFKLIGKEKKSSTVEILGSKLHWHRTAVNTVRWSRDRNYIISGGSETVLVIWQLDTNQKQFLPHLSTSILGLAVSDTGSAYALRLGDNSVMVLSTADLLPSSSISGLALGDSRQSSLMVLHPNVPNQLLAAVPAQAIAKGLQQGKSSTILQVYDVESNLQISRQALTRNVTTALNVGPSGQSVREPNVTQIAVSHDGKWLVTLDEWQPNDQDVEMMYIGADNSTIRGQTTETCLRFWTWVGDDNNWELVTRIDEPHQSGPCSVLGVAVNPVRLEVATIGSDASIRIWSPKGRHRNGVSVRNQSNEQLYTWTVSRTIPCEHDAYGRTEPATSAVLAYSDDGSVLACSWSWPASPVRFVHLVDPDSGKMCISQPDLLPHKGAKIAFSGRYLLCLSQSLTVFDTLTAQSIATMTFDPLFASPQGQNANHLATNSFDGTVAVGIPRSQKPWATKILVLSIRGTEAKVIHEASFGGFIKGLLAVKTGPGYLIVDERNGFRSLKPVGVSRMALTTALNAKQETDQVTRSIDSIFGRASLAEDPTVVPPQGLLTGAENDKDLSRGLDAVLRIVSSAQAPSPAELFQKVLGALAGGLREA